MTKSLTLTALSALMLATSAPAAFAGDAAAGEAQWRNCRSCHSIVSDSGDTVQRGGRTGPNLYGLPGRAIGSVDGFRYSDGIVAVGAAGLTWTEALFVEYMADPTAFLAAHGGGGRSGMNFRMTDGAADMWAYLESVSQ
jgi:cytochrome c